MFILWPRFLLSPVHPIGCTCRSEFSCMVHSIASLTCLAVDLLALSPTASVHYSRLEMPSFRLSPIELSRLSANKSGTTYRPMWRLLSRCLYIPPVAENTPLFEIIPCYFMDIN